MASILRRSGYYAAEIYFKDWKNNALEPPSRAELDSLLKILSGERITLAALSLRASAYLKTAAMLTGLIREKAGIPVLWGGAHAILCPEESARIADIVCVGEGEEAILDLAGRLSTGVSIDDTPNFWVRRGDEIIRNPISNLIQDLDSIPFRDYTSLDKFVIDGGRVTRRDPMIEDPVFQVITSRGCPYQCSYCYNSTYREIFRDKGKYCRKRSVDNVILELKQAKSLFKNLKRIKFDDEVFPFQKEWVDEFVQKYPVQVGLPFEAFTEPSLVEPELFARLKEAGLQIVYMGIQSSERITRQLYDRAAPKEQVRRAAGVLHGLGLDTRFQVIIDDPLSGPEDREELFRLLMSLERPFELYLFSLTVFPNTGLARRLLKDGLITPGQIEGEDTKTFRQLRVDLSYPRDPLSTYWAAMLVLLSKSFIPPWLLWKFFGNEGLRRNPRPLVILAQVSNFLKMAWVAAGMLLRGELTWVGAKRWLNLKSLITQ
jgi:radical SAM superfamily enzyme YgiQ (UPF0313 family)